MRPDFINQLSNPEYTGENRCTPCTIVNLFIGAMIGALVAKRSAPAGVLAAGLSAGLIYLRGYLVPGTPVLTKRYLPEPVLRLFGKKPEPVVATGFDGTGGSDTEPPAATDVESRPSPNDTAGSYPNDDGPSPTTDLEGYLLSEGILETRPDGDLGLTDEFEANWLAVGERLVREDLNAEAVAETFGLTDQDPIELIEQGNARLFRTDMGEVGQWPSHAALAADVAAGRVLRSWTSEWSELDPEMRGQLLTGLRVFLETCPGSGGSVETGVNTVQSCCSSKQVYAVTCTETGERLFEYPAAEI